MLIELVFFDQSWFLAGNVAGVVPSDNTVDQSWFLAGNVTA